MFFKLTKIFTESVENFISVQGQGPPQQNEKYDKVGRTGKFLNGKIMSVERMVS